MDIETVVPAEDVIGIEITVDGENLRILYHTDSDTEKWSTIDSLFGSTFDIHQLRSGVNTTYHTHLKICEIAENVAGLQD